MTTPIEWPETDSLRAAYAAACDHWIHAEQLRWTILYNFLVANSILLVVWATVFSVLSSRPSSVGARIVLTGLCVIGGLGSVVWALLEYRANLFADTYFEAGLRVEERVLQDATGVGPFAVNRDMRAKRGGIRTRIIVIVVPAAFGVVYVGLLIVSVYASIGVF